MIHIHIYTLHIYVIFKGVMELGNIAPRVGIEDTALAFLASDLSCLILPLYPHLPIYAALCLRGYNNIY